MLTQKKVFVKILKEIINGKYKKKLKLKIQIKKLIKIKKPRFRETAYNNQGQNHCPYLQMFIENCERGINSC